MTETIVIRDQQARQRLVEHILDLDPDKVWEITVAPYRKKRSNNQLRLFWAWVDQVVDVVHDYSGQDKDDIAGFLKAKFLTPKRVTVGEDTRTYYTTRDLTTTEMNDFMTKAHAWAASELGLILPTPDLTP